MISFGTKSDVLDLLNQIEEVTHWYSCMPHCIFLTSTFDAQQIATEIRSHFGEKPPGLHLVVEVHHDRQGWLPKKAWHLFQNPSDPSLKDE